MISPKMLSYRLDTINDLQQSKARIASKLLIFHLYVIIHSGQLITGTLYEYVFLFRLFC